MKNNNHFKKQHPPKSYELEYNEEFQAMVLSVLDTEGMYPLYWRDPDAGTYRICKNQSGKLMMTK